MDTVVVLDFGGQYAHLIANRVHRLNVFAEIMPAETSAGRLSSAKAIIISGGPSSVTDPDAPKADKAIFSLGIPILGICYGHQLIAKELGGKVSPAGGKEYGHALLRVGKSALFNGLEPEESVWMSHGDLVEDPPPGFSVIGKTEDCPVAAMADERRRVYGLQFHPEVTHTPNGMKILDNFLAISGCRREWTIDHFLNSQVAGLSKIDRKVFLLVSGGVDSAVCFALLGKALGKGRVKGLHIDTGLMRTDESQGVLAAMGSLGLGLDFIDESERFFAALAGVTDPEEKRRVIGEAFVEVAQEAMLGLDSEEWLLAQGTIYPDTIETQGTKHAALIKTHHNRVPMMQRLIDQGKVIEPLRQLYKDEVRELGSRLGLSKEIISRHPFPGPGLAVRCLCHDGINQEIDPDDQERLRELAWPLRAVIAPVRSVGVQGDSRTYRHPGIVFGKAEWQELDRLHTIPNKLQAVNRMLYLLSPGEPQITLKAASVTRERISLLRKADRLVHAFVAAHGLGKDIWQFPVVLLPMGGRFGESIVLRPVVSREAMTAGYARLPLGRMRDLSQSLLSLGLDAVYYDFTTKPPATIEWE
ncbi:MAG: glutamine-hydrolyzing GMP synthase [Nanoarchaeota archaeon]